MPQDPASYRDPAGHVHRVGDKIYRSVLPPGVDHYTAARDSGFLERATAIGRLIEGREVAPTVLRCRPLRCEPPRKTFKSFRLGFARRYLSAPRKRSCKMGSS